jgi:hypothetical protein
MVEDQNRSLRILIANERDDRLARIAKIVTELGHVRPATTAARCTRWRGP